jgi:hypothetical protein
MIGSIFQGMELVLAVGSGAGSIFGVRKPLLGMAGLSYIWLVELGQQKVRAG